MIVDGLWYYSRDCLEKLQLEGYDDMLIQWCMGLGIFGFFWDRPERYA